MSTVLISAWLIAFLISQEPLLRKMAVEEQGTGKFSLGLSRCIDLLDNRVRWAP